MMNYYKYNKLVAAAYDGFAENEEVRTRYGLSKIEANLIREKLEKFIPNGGRVADIGSGPGVFSLWLAELGMSVELMDLSERSIELARFRSKRKSIDCQKRLSFNIVGADNLGKFGTSNFDAVIEFGPIYHASSISHAETILIEARRLLKEDGYLFVNFANASLLARECFESRNFEGSSQALSEIDANGHYLFKSPSDDLSTWGVTPKFAKKLLSEIGFRVVEVFGTEIFHSKKAQRDQFNLMQVDDEKLINNIVKAASENEELMGCARFLFYVLKKA